MLLARPLPARPAVAAHLVAALLVTCTALAGQDATPPLEGHSHIGEAFNEGPRQAAYLMPGMNDRVTFAVTTTSDEARAFIRQGIVQLHGFWYFESERSFRQAAALDPECAMAYWGMAASNVENEPRAHGFARKAWALRDNVTDRERRYIEALGRFYGADRDAGGDWQPPASRSDADRSRRRRLVEDWEELIHHHPDDIEARAFLANRLWLNSRAGLRVESRLAAQSLLDPVFAHTPLHPAHHYRIHLWDTVKTAARAVPSAAVIGRTAPGIAHMWHMGGHIWARLDRHADAAWQQEASARVDHAHMMRDRVMPDQIHNYAHNNEWLCRSLRHVGRVRDSLDLARNMVELPRHPAWNLPGMRSSSSSYGPRRLAETLETFEAWDEATALADTMYLDAGDAPGTRALRLRLLARVAFDRRDAGALRDLVGQCEAALNDARAARAKAVDDAEERALVAEAGRKEVEQAMDAAERGPTRTVRTVRGVREQVSGLLALLEAKGDASARDAALKALEEARHDKTHLSRLWLEAGNPAKAIELAEQACENKGRAQPLANLVHVLHAAGKHDEAKRRFGELRALSAHFDLDYAPFSRVAPVASALGLPADWHAPPTRPADVGERGDLEALGPFRWAPSPAPAWTLPRASRLDISLADYRGRPVVVVFFLGHGCVHCVEQLQAMAPMKARFDAAGIDLVAIGTDTREQLRAAERGGDAYPFPIAADPGLEVFRRYRCHDDFEKLALHGTFLIDGHGRVRWQDIGYEPFMDIEFLLGEAQRLLRLAVQ